MRTIKFRAWDKKQKKMFNNVSTGTISIWDDNNEAKSIDCEFMQFTGLLDKNGVEIYEGDIIEFPYITPFGDIDYKTVGETRVVKFKNGAFGFESKTTFMPIQDFIETESGEYISNAGNIRLYKDFIGKVIGNIYEKKE